MMLVMTRTRHGTQCAPSVEFAFPCLCHTGFAFHKDLPVGNKDLFAPCHTLLDMGCRLIVFLSFPYLKVTEQYCIYIK